MKKPVLKKIYRNILLQLIFLLGFVAILNTWQTKNLASGVAKQFLLSSTSKIDELVPQNSTGKKLSIVYFMAPWCGVCRVSVPNLDSFRSDMSDVDVQIVALDYEAKEDVTAFTERHSIQAPIFLGTEEVRRFWGVSAYPTYFVVNEAGLIRAKSVGYSTKFGMMFRVFWAQAIDLIFWWD